MAKAIVLGAGVCGIALPFLRKYCTQGPEGVTYYIQQLAAEFKRAMLLTGCAQLGDLCTLPHMLGAVLSCVTGEDC